MALGLWIYLMLSGLVLLFSVVGNSLLIYCVFRFQKLRSVTNVLICNLSVCDIILAGFIIPQKLHDMSHEEHFHEGEFLCKVVNFGPIFIITTSIYTLVFISVERRRSVSDRSKEQLTFTIIGKIIPIVWILGLIVSLPTLVEYVVVETYDENVSNMSLIALSCGSYHLTDPFSISNAVFVTFTSYIIPCVIIFKNYIHVACFVWKTSKNMRTGVSFRRDSSAFHLVKNRLKILILLAAVAAIFIFSWLPFFIFLLIAKITNKDASSDASGVVNLLLVGLATFSTAYNVILYGVYNPSFSRALYILFKHNTRVQTKNKCLEHVLLRLSTQDGNRRSNEIPIQSNV